MNDVLPFPSFSSNNNMPAAVDSRLGLIVSLAFHHLTSSHLRIPLFLPHTPQTLFPQNVFTGYHANSPPFKLTSICNAKKTILVSFAEVHQISWIFTTSPYASKPSLFFASEALTGFGELKISSSSSSYNARRHQCLFLLQSWVDGKGRSGKGDGGLQFCSLSLESRRR
jgi:hypothetical protein